MNDTKSPCIAIGKPEKSQVNKVYSKNEYVLLYQYQRRHKLYTGHKTEKAAQRAAFNK